MSKANLPAIWRRFLTLKTLCFLEPPLTFPPLLHRLYNMGEHGRTSLISGSIVKMLVFITVIFTVIIGIGLGFSLAETVNIKNQENFVEFAPALPTKILDINGTLITEFSADEKRELVSLSVLPRHLIQAVLAREDPQFYSHRGFSVKAIVRATAGQILRQNWGGGSTITQQVAGTL